jgi:sugar phosphate isomerase/epimerase
MKRRTILATLPAVAAGLPIVTAAKEHAFEISLAQWSLYRSFFGPGLSDFAKFGELLDTDPRAVLQGELDPLDFPAIARNEFGVDAVEYVNTFYFDRAKDSAYLEALRTRAADAGVRSLLIMCDRLGMVAATDAATRSQTLENHKPWLEAAQLLGCHSIRTNVAGEGSRADVAAAAVDGLGQLAELAAPHELDVLVENHGGLSSDGGWLAGVMRELNHPRVGTLPDFGNFRISARQRYDNYQGVSELMPWAKSVSAKSYDFDVNGNETTIDYDRMLGIVVDAGFSGYVGVEYEGRRLSEFDGIRATKRLLERVRADIG